MQKAMALNDLYETLFLEKYKKSLHEKTSKKLEEIEEYKKKKKYEILTTYFNIIDCFV